MRNNYLFLTYKGNSSLCKGAITLYCFSLEEALEEAEELSRYEGLRYELHSIGGLEIYRPKNMFYRLWNFFHILRSK
jgi:hypothetical protein